MQIRRLLFFLLLDTFLITRNLYLRNITLGRSTVFARNEEYCQSN